MILKKVLKSIYLLEKLNANLHEIIKSIQPFRCNDDWLFVLCDGTNMMKHRNLIKQERFEMVFKGVPAGASIHFREGLFSSRYYLKGTYTNSNNKHIPLTVNKKSLRNTLLEAGVIKVLNFHFDATTIDVLDFLVKAYNEINVFQEKIYNELQLII